jgi:hypothetical protein
MARPLTPREATEMILANRLRHGGGSSSDSARPLRAERRRPTPAQQQRPAPAGAQRSDKKE